MQRRSQTKSEQNKISRLPVEILEIIFSFLPFANGLRECRLVNLQWRDIVNSLCRRRFIQILPTTWQINESCIIFRDRNNLPWSACSVDLWDTDRLLKLSFSGTNWIVPSQKFLSVFGPHILKLTASGTSADVIGLISCTPNIQVLKISFSTRMSKPMLPEGEKTIKLLKLKYFEVRFGNTPDAVQVFDYIIKNSPNLTRLKVTQLEEYCAEILSAMPKIPSISICFIYYSQYWKNYSEKILNVRELDLEITNRTDGGGKPIEKFLSDISQTLQSLFLRLFLCHVSDRLEIQKLPTFRVLKSVEFAKSFEYDVERNLVDLRPFTSNEFPVLEKVKINGSCKIFSLFQNSIFHSVSELEFQVSKEERRYVSHCMVHDWASVCPNLKKLVAVVDITGLRYVLKKMQNLEHLSLSVQNRFGIFYGQHSSRNVQKDDINSIISGITQKKFLYGKNTELEFKFVKNTNIAPSLLSFPRLKSLKLEIVYPHENTITDGGAYNSLMKMQPLHLSLIGVNITQPCSDGLASYHLSFIKE